MVTFKLAVASKCVTEHYVSVLNAVLCHARQKYNKKKTYRLKILIKILSILNGMDEFVIV